MPSRNVIAKLKGHFAVTDDLKGDLEHLLRERTSLEPGQHLIRSGEAFKGLYLIEDGWMIRSRNLPGGSRQIVNFALPGDFLCFNAMMFERSEFDLVARTAVTLWKLEAKNFRTMMARHPGLAEALVWSNAHEESLLAERVVSLGRRDAIERLAHVLCEIAARLELIERHEGDVLSMPLLQEDLADILGLSVIHIVRVFNKLEEMGAVEYRSRRILLKDPEKLRRIAGFEGGYIYFSQRKDVLPRG